MNLSVWFRIDFMPFTPYDQMYVCSAGIAGPKTVNKCNDDMNLSE